MLEYMRARVSDREMLTADEGLERMIVNMISSDFSCSTRLEDEESSCRIRLFLISTVVTFNLVNIRRFDTNKKFFGGNIT